jgi:hypothetical protein
LTLVRHSELLRLKIHLAESQLGQASDSIVHHVDVAQLYPQVLFRTHCVARASAPLMQAALDEARRRVSDPVCAGICDYLVQHIVEEREHAAWIEEDFACLGTSAMELARRIPPANIACAVGAHYYWIKHFHPVAVLGYIAVLEGAAPRLSWVENLMARTKLPAQAFRTLKIHALVDIEHATELDALLDRLPLQQVHHDLLRESAFLTIDALSRELVDVVRRHERDAARRRIPTTQDAVVDSGVRAR